MLHKFFLSVFAIVCTMLCSEHVWSQQRYDIVITELMADPTPQVGLPNSEWIEIHNRSSAAINLQGWRLTKTQGSPSGPLQATTLQPDSFLIICTASQVPALSAFGKTVSVTSFPSLGNAGDLIAILDANGNTIHAINYTDDWYNNPVKQDGGWSIEMIDTDKPCLGKINWRASIDPSGGTPGRANSIKANLQDNSAPEALHAFPASATMVSIYFNEPVGSTGSIPGNFSIQPAIAITEANAQAPLFDKVNLLLAQPLQLGTIYTIQINNISDCSGNTSVVQTVSVALPQITDSNDIVINEVLFDPAPLVDDYVELYNRSNKVLDAAQLRLANRSSSTGNIGSVTPLFAEPRLFFPGNYFCFTTNKNAVQQAYTVADSNFLFETPSLPTYPNDKGWVLVLNGAGTIIDELAYDDDWHFALIDNKEGVALERLQYDSKTQDSNNWTSASAASGFGTPTAPNSQKFAPNNSAAIVSVSPKVFSPDNDGFDDFCLLDIKTQGPGFTANITIYDAQGRPVRVLQRNATVGVNNRFRWDGLNDKQQRVTPGNYIVFTDLFNLSGSRQQFKTVVTVAFRF